MEGLRRDTEAGIVAGVAAGIARRLDVGPSVVRLAFVAACFFGGLGLLLYVAAWLLVPADGEPRSILENWLSSSSDRNPWVGAALIGLAVLILVASLETVNATMVAAAALFVVGVLLYRGFFDETPTGEPASDRLEPGSGSTKSSSSGSESTPTAAVVSPVAPADPPARQPEPPASLAPPPSDAPSTYPPSPPGAPPTQGPPRRQPVERSPLGLVTVAAVLVVVGVMGIVDSTDAVAISLSSYFAAAVITVGAGLLIGTFFGRSRVLILIGVLLLAGLQFTSWFDIPLVGGFGDPRFQPDRIAAIQDEYRLIAGQLWLDLTEVSDLATVEGQVESDVSLAAGSLRIIVPAAVPLDLDARVIAGELHVGEEQQLGTDLEYRLREEGSGGALRLDVEVGFGEVHIVREGN